MGYSLWELWLCVWCLCMWEKIKIEIGIEREDSYIGTIKWFWELKIWWVTVTLPHKGSFVHSRTLVLFNLRLGGGVVIFKVCFCFCLFEGGRFLFFSFTQMANTFVAPRARTHTHARAHTRFIKWYLPLL